MAHAPFGEQVLYRWTFSFGQGLRPCPDLWDYDRFGSKCPLIQNLQPLGRGGQNKWPGNINSLVWFLANYPIQNHLGIKSCRKVPPLARSAAKQQHGVSWGAVSTAFMVEFPQLIWANPLCSHSNSSWGWVELSWAVTISKKYSDFKIPFNFQRTWRVIMKSRHIIIPAVGMA
jgi:hypothetical protein